MKADHHADVRHGRRGGLIKAWTRGVPMDERANEQIDNIAAMPFIHRHVAIMPDAHWGLGATIGSVIPTVGAIIPAAVGVDIGCGMMAQRTNIRADRLPDSLRSMRDDIEHRIPVGRTDNGGTNDKGAHTKPIDIGSLRTDLNRLLERHPKIERAARRAGNHMGTLGTGNHFIELCLDEQDYLWIMLHSGSRGIGNRIGTYFIELAKQDMRKWFINLPDQNLAYLAQGTEHFDDYIEAVNWAQKYALENRRHMMNQVIGVLRDSFADFALQESATECHHNYVSAERHFGKQVLVTRKGAVSAQAGELGIIPGSMGTRSFIVRGKGNAESFCSCSHGAGRVMSRNQARKEITLEQHVAATAGVECRKDAHVIDESPAAYKDIDRVMDAQSDLVEIVYELRQVVCVKG